MAEMLVDFHKGLNKWTKILKLLFLNEMTKGLVSMALEMVTRQKQSSSNRQLKLGYLGYPFEESGISPETKFHGNVEKVKLNNLCSTT